MCDITHPCVRHDSFISVTWLIHMRDMKHSYAWHDSFIRVTWLIHMWVVSCIHMCDVTDSYVSDMIPHVTHATESCHTWTQNVFYLRGRLCSVKSSRHPSHTECVLPQAMLTHFCALIMSHRMCSTCTTGSSIHPPSLPHAWHTCT